VVLRRIDHARESEEGKDMPETHPTHEWLHPLVQELQREDPWCISVLAALARSADTCGTLADLDDAELASHLLILQDAGLLSLWADESGRLSYVLHAPNRRERRQKRRGQKNSRPKKKPGLRGR
jgi:hypothetical protein